MIRVHIDKYLELGQRMASARVHWTVIEDQSKDKIDEYNAMLNDDLNDLLSLCRELNLTTSEILIARRMKPLPKSEDVLDVLLDAVDAELKSRLVLFIPPHRAEYYEANAIVSTIVKDAFPGASSEIRNAGTCFATALYTASVFHSMRAAEIGLRSLAEATGVTFPFPIELADWQNQIEKVEAEIKQLAALPKSVKKDEDLSFYSEAATHFRYFKDAWRIRVSHARETYEEGQALSVLNHVREFFDVLAKRLKEPGLPAVTPSRTATMQRRSRTKPRSANLTRRKSP
jgi:hypothetical protein